VPPQLADYGQVREGGQNQAAAFTEFQYSMSFLLDSRSSGRIVSRQEED